MKKRILSLFLALVTLLGILPTAALPSLAASTPEDALGEIDVYNGGKSVKYLSVNGSNWTLNYVYYKFTRFDGANVEVPVYCVNPTTDGVPQVVGPGESVKYTANEKASDPKVVGIICNGYPHYSLKALNLDDKYQAYYATKMALWCYLIPNWSVDKLKVASGLSAKDKEIANRVLHAVKTIYQRGTTYNYMMEPKITATPDKSLAYPVTVDGKQYKQQVFTLKSETFVYNYDVAVSFSDPNSVPAGTRIVDMDNRDITAVTTDGFKGGFKVLYPADSIQGETGSIQLALSASVAKYAVLYGICAEKNVYGNLQNYICDVDNNKWLELAAVSSYQDDPDKPDKPDPEETALKIIKLEAGTELPLEGAVFSVYDPAGRKVGSYSTGPDGTVTIPLTLEGHYTVTEEIPPRYHLLPNIRTQHADVEYNKVAELTFWNEPYGNLRVQKRSDTGGELNGVTVQIKHIESGEVRTGTTLMGGAVVFDQLKPGSYEVRETAGIPGWIADTDTVQTVEVLPGRCSDVIIVNKELPGLRIVKYDRKKGEMLPGVTFEIWRDGTSLGRFRTDQFGEIVLTDVQPGTYRAAEADTGNAGLILDTTPQEVELHAGDGIKELLFFNDTKPGMKLVKVDSADPSRVIPNAVFEIRSVKGDYGPEEFRTDRNGEIDLSHLPAGAYVVTEKSCEGYIIDEAQRVIHLDPNEDAEFVFTNTVKPSLRLMKTSSDGTPLAGVHFRIAKIEDGSHYLDRITDDSGEINISGLEPGVYSVKETATTSDHILDVREYHVELFPGQTSTITLENQKRPSLTIRKTDKDTGAPVVGVTFTLQGADGPTITTEPTDQDGTVKIVNLLPGVYTVTEQNVPENYILDATPQTVTLFPNREAQVQFQNYQRPTLKIAKVDINGRPLTGAIFEVKTKAGVKIGDFPVGADGTITVPQKHLAEGYYIVTEKQAPEGYILDKTPHEVYLRPGKTTEISIENEKKPGLTIYKVDSVVGDGIKGAKFEIYVSKDKTEHGTYQKLDSTFYFTDANGIIHLDNLDTGWYKIVEVEPAAGFTIKEPAEQIIYIEHDKAAEVTFENTPLNAVIVEKYDSVTHAALPGCTFQLRYLAGTSGTGGTVIGTKVTSKNGTCIWTGLKPGAYVIEVRP